MKRLKPCPFCGSKAEYFQDRNGIMVEDMTIEPNVVHFVVCSECPALVSGSSEQEAIEAWNRRIKDADL